MMVAGQGKECGVKKCWVGEQEKICYGDKEEAEMVARLVEREHGWEVGTLGVYKCEYGEHWHLSRN
jgi:hypothetical protein